MDLLGVAVSLHHVASTLHCMCRAGSVLRLLFTSSDVTRVGLAFGVLDGLMTRCLPVSLRLEFLRPPRATPGHRSEEVCFPRHLSKAGYLADGRACLQPVVTPHPRTSFH